MTKATESTKKVNKVFNEENINNAKAKAKEIWQEVKEFAANMTWGDWVLLGAALTFSFITVTELFGDKANQMVESFKKLWNKARTLSFWKLIFLCLVLIYTTTRVSVLSKEYKDGKKKEEGEEKTEETKEE